MKRIPRFFVARQALLNDEGNIFNHSRNYTPTAAIINKLSLASW
jgi:hypothetical protein